MKIRNGIGYDIHRLVPDRKLYLGGVAIPFSKGLQGHSDGDCLVHALIDALLGAAGEKDIGQLFPDDDPATKGIQSIELLRQVMERLEAKQLTVIHVDMIVVAEAPCLAPYIDAIKEVLCPLLGIEKTNLGIKAKTHEGLGPLGRQEAIAAWAQVLLTESAS